MDRNKLTQAQTEAAEDLVCAHLAELGLEVVADTQEKSIMNKHDKIKKAEAEETPAGKPGNQ